MQPDVIFVGAGPVGLLTAIQFKLFNPHAEVLMLEKHEKYQREHPLAIDPASYKGAHPDPRFQALIEELSGNIRTNEIEEKLLKFAESLGIEIQKNVEVKDCAALKEQYPTAKFIVGSDGSHSVVHKQVFEHQYQLKEMLQYIAEIKYEVDGKTRYLETITESYPVTTQVDFVLSEFIGKEKENKIPVSIRIFIDKETYEDSKQADFKHPISLETLKGKNKSLHDTILTWLIAREAFAKEQRMPGTEKITTTNLSIYASKDFVKKEGEVTYLLVGDAAFGVPYFRSMNNGIICSIKLAKAMDAEFNHKSIQHKKISSTLFSDKDETPLDYYKNNMQKLVNKEVRLAEIKATALKSLQSTAKIAQSELFASTARLKFSKTPGGRTLKKQLEAEGLGRGKTKKVDCRMV